MASVLQCTYYSVHITVYITNPSQSPLRQEGNLLTTSMETIWQSVGHDICSMLPVYNVGVICGNRGDNAAAVFSVADRHVQLGQT